MNELSKAANKLFPRKAANGNINSDAPFSPFGVEVEENINVVFVVVQ